MRKAFITLITVLAIGTSMTIAQAALLRTEAISAPWRNVECRYQTLDGRTGWNTEEVKRTIQCATKKKGLDTSQALMIASHESGFSAYARNSSSGACGVFQHLPNYWPDRISGTNQAYYKLRTFSYSCFDARSNIFAAVRLAKSSGGWYYHWCKWASYC